MDYQQLNEILSNINNLRNGKKKYPLIFKADQDDNINESYTTIEIYKLPHDDIFIKLKFAFDSYGDNEHLTGIEFVKQVTKDVITYEPI